MKILFDGVFNADPTSGVHRYFYDLINNLPAEYYKFSTSSLSRTTIPHHYIPFFSHFRPHKFSFFLEYLWFKRKLYTCQFDCVHSAYYNLSKASQFLVQKKIPHVITVHDLIHEIFNVNNKTIINSRKPILENANAIITVSENTKNDLLNIYPLVNEDKIFIT